MYRAKIEGMKLRLGASADREETKAGFPTRRKPGVSLPGVVFCLECRLPAVAPKLLVAEGR